MAHDATSSLQDHTQDSKRQRQHLLYHRAAAAARQRILAIFPPFTWPQQRHRKSSGRLRATRQKTGRGELHVSKLPKWFYTNIGFYGRLDEAKDKWLNWYVGHPLIRTNCLMGEEGVTRSWTQHASSKARAELEPINRSERSRNSSVISLLFYGCHKSAGTHMHRSRSKYSV